MPRELYVVKNFSAPSLLMIERSNAIIAEYQAAGFTLTLRQLYYQHVARGFIPNKQTEYKRLGSVINDARLAGLIDWSAIEDRTRNLRDHSSWDSPAAIVDACASQFKFDPWKDQPYAVEVWIEKDALVGVIEPVCNRYRLPFFACRGYTSQSEQWNAGKRLLAKKRNGKEVIIFHLGDHDPSGIDMTRDNSERINMFARGGIKIRRLALNMDQVREYDPPPNPAKATDARFEGYVSEYGDESWELDALDPKVIDSLIEDELKPLLDDDAWAASMDREQKARGVLKAAAENWEEIEERYGESD